MAIYQMNERIKILLAKFKETESTHRGDAVLIGFDEIEKFAELLIKECADVATVNQYQAFTPGYYVKKHFGVKE